MSPRKGGRRLEFWPLADIEATLEHDLIPAAILPLAIVPPDDPGLAALEWAVRLRSPATSAELTDIAWFGWDRAEGPCPVALVAVVAAGGARAGHTPGPVAELRMWRAEDAADLAARLGGDVVDLRPADPLQGRLFAA